MVSHIPSDARPQPAPTQAAGPGHADASPPRLRVLLVEDDEGDAFLVGELLDEADAPVDLIVATHLSEAQAA